jgi:branched-chain amino acid transport system substrate-binding protein
MRGKKRTSFLAVAALLAILGAACSGNSSKVTGSGSSAAPASTEPIKIGVVGPMTGLASFVGKNMIEGIQLAVDDINQAKLLGGRPVEFVQRDDEYDPAKTVTAVRDLIEKEHVVALFGPASATTYLAVQRIIHDAQIPSWVIAAGSQLGQDPYAFRAFIPDSIEINALGKFLPAHFSKIAIVGGNDPESGVFNNAMKAALTANGKPPVAIATFAVDDTDYSPIALKIKQSGADAVVLGTHLGLFGARYAQAQKNIGGNAKIFGLAGLINYTYPDLARDAADGTTFVSFRSWGFLPKTQWPPAVLDFYQRYVKRYLPDGEFSETGAYKAYSTNFLTYDMVRIWAAAVEKANSADPKKVADVLNAGFTYPADKSVIGVPWQYSAADHDGIKPGDLYFYRWELQPTGKFKLAFLGTVADVVSGKTKI